MKQLAVILGLILAGTVGYRLGLTSAGKEADATQGSNQAAMELPGSRVGADQAGSEGGLAKIDSGVSRDVGSRLDVILANGLQHSRFADWSPDEIQQALL